MIITITAAAFIPHTQAKVEIRAAIDEGELDAMPFPELRLLFVVESLRDNVNQEVNREMKVRGIELGPDGLRKPSHETPH
jgi:hypothetical protein